MNWAEYRGPCPPDICRAWAAMHDDLMAVGSVFEMSSGAYKAVYSLVGQACPTSDGPFVTLADAKRHVETIVATKLIRPRPVLLDHGFQ